MGKIKRKMSNCNRCQVRTATVFILSVSLFLFSLSLCFYSLCLSVTNNTRKKTKNEMFEEDSHHDMLKYFVSIRIVRSGQQHEYAPSQ